MLSLLDLRFSRMLHVGLTLTLLAGLSKSAYAGGETLEFLRSSLPIVEIEWLDSHLLSLCPDNTCEEIAFSTAVKSAEAEDLAAIYLYAGSGYWFLDDWRKQDEVRNFVRVATRKYAPSECAGLDDAVAAKCALQRLLRDGHIRIRYVRFDEGVKVVVPAATPLGDPE